MYVHVHFQKKEQNKKHDFTRNNIHLLFLKKVK